MEFLVKQSDGHMVLPGRNSITFLWCNKFWSFWCWHLFEKRDGKHLLSKQTIQCRNWLSGDINLKLSGKGWSLTQQLISFLSVPSVRKRNTTLEHPSIRKQEHQQLSVSSKSFYCTLRWCWLLGLLSAWTLY